VQVCCRRLDCGLWIASGYSGEHTLQTLLSLLDGRFKLPARSTLSDKHIPVAVADLKSKLTEKLTDIKAAANVTVDIWSDRTMRSFMGITVHMLEKSASTYHLTSYLLDCRRFAGQHTGENTGSCFSEVTAQ